MTFPLTPEQYAKATAALKTEKGIVFSQLGNQGLLSTSQVDLAYSYDGTGTLTIVVTKKHGLARFATDATIQQHIQDLIAGVTT